MFRYYHQIAPRLVAGKSISRLLRRQQTYRAVCVVGEQCRLDMAALDNAYEAVRAQ
jgi:hypothetical protein